MRDLLRVAFSHPDVAKNVILATGTIVAAIIAGIFLGWLSYRSGSILLGLILHCTVAVSMDVLALSHKGLLF